MVQQICLINSLFKNKNDFGTDKKWSTMHHVPVNEKEQKQ